MRSRRFPEGLPIVATLALARGMWRMARHNALIERLSAVETLGATTIILTDKTGTLTENRMAVRRLWVASGEIEIDGRLAETTAMRGADPQFAARCCEVAVLCNDATLGRRRRTAAAIRWSWRCCAPGRRAGLDAAALLHGQRRSSRKHAFDTGTKMMATVHRRAATVPLRRQGRAGSGARRRDGVMARRTATCRSTMPTRREWLRERVEQLGHHGPARAGLRHEDGARRRCRRLTKT